MSGIELSGLPVLIIVVGTVIVGAVPVWFAAKIVGAGNATLPGAILAMIAGAVGVAAALFTAPIIGGWALLLAPIAYLMAFKSILQTSFFGAIILVILSIALSVAMGKIFGGGISPIH